jgi:ubiquinone/menaquinone biosynthesis C-methylase UbiE
VSKILVKKYLQPNTSDVMLDFGCGIGRLTEILAPFSRRIVGVDFSSKMIETANDKRQANNTAYHYLSNAQLPFEDQEFSKIFTFWVLAHNADDQVINYLIQFRRLLSPNGHILLFEHIRPETKVLSDVHIQRSIHHYAELAEKAGLYMEQYQLVLRSPSYALSLWNRFRFMDKFLLSILAVVEKYTVNRKPEHADYYTCMMKFVTSD